MLGCTGLAAGRSAGLAGRAARQARRRDPGSRSLPRPRPGAEKARQNRSRSERGRSRSRRTGATGWDPRGWSVDQAARILILLHAGGTGAVFAQRFTQLCRTADVAEAIAFYRGLPLYPGPERLEAQAAEGTRTNMRAVFEAVAHRSPYPKEQFAENRWNHMVLKALFVGSALHPIQGLDERTNPTLARMLCDYAHERWAAGRPVSPELWRCVGPMPTQRRSRICSGYSRPAAPSSARRRRCRRLPRPESHGTARLGAGVRQGDRARPALLGVLPTSCS